MSTCDDVLQADAEAVVELAKVHHQSPHVLYRETLASHFPTSNGLYQPNLRETRCRADGAMAKPEVLVSVAKVFSTAAHPKVDVIDAWTMTRTQPELHSVRHVTNASDALDCTHYCSWSGINDALIDAIAVWAAEIVDS